MSKRTAKDGERGGRPPAPASTPGGIDLEAVRALARIAGDFDLEEIEADPSGRIRLRRARDGTAAPVGRHLPGPSIALAPPLSPAEVPAEARIYVTSPFVGTFYRSPSPDAPAFADLGQVVRKGQVVCIVEAMKLMNEIEAETDGRVEEILVKNGEHVEYGQNLFRLSKV